MRTSWLVVIAVVLGAGPAARAQESMIQKLLNRPTHPKSDTWATQYNPPAAPEPGSVVASTSPDAQHGVPEAPVVVPPAGAGVAHPPAPACCPGGCCPGGACSGGACAGGACHGDAHHGGDCHGGDCHGGDCHGGDCGKGGCGCCFQLHYGPGCDCNRLSCCERLLGWLCHHPLFCKDQKGKCCHIPPLYLYTYHECTEPRPRPELPCCAFERGLFRSILCSGHAWGTQPGGHGCCVEP
jgi:hypothetical protein